MKPTTYQVTVGPNGSLVLPLSLRRRNHIRVGDQLTLQSTGDSMLMLTRPRTSLSQTADRLAKAWQHEGLTLADLLEALRQVREEHDN